ncbi:MAG: GIY-YIG nuclease family protein [Gammaproteobacteria bacterium]|nr:GIY-YIG nuclease family protein [Gammaproteobacteria bacterium]MBT8111359.1 GIY-YIG nuclease family protein [Gammaproteobacteria bacterium]NND47916.1 GIY-YIG nuclease family protein [Woeseiaceae bacterium]NNL46057.1 GIY-YIG nuclease family protein [Woeseiaceae bacterium]
MTSSVVFSLYIVRCSDDTLYTGIAADVRKRIAEHESSPRGAKYLRGKGPLRLEFVEPVGDRGAASTLEFRVKRLTRARKEALISGRESLADLLHDADPGQASGAG